MLIAGKEEDGTTVIADYDPATHRIMILDGIMGEDPPDYPAYRPGESFVFAEDEGGQPIDFSIQRYWTPLIEVTIGEWQHKGK